MIRKKYSVNAIITIALASLISSITFGCSLSDNSVESKDEAIEETNPWASTITQENFDDKFGVDSTDTSTTLTAEELPFIGNWYGSSETYATEIFVQFLADGTFKLEKIVNTGKFENTPQHSLDSGTWVLKNSNSQLHLTTSEASTFIYSNRYPKMFSEQNIPLFKDSIDTSITMEIDTTKDVIEVSSDTSDAVRAILNTKVTAKWSEYFTIVGTKINSEEDWEGLTPNGYNYGNKVYKPFKSSEVADWEYAIERSKTDPNYVVVITYDDWQTHFGHRINFASEIMENPEKLYQWFEIWKATLQKLNQIQGPVLVANHPDPMATWSGEIQRDYNGDPKNVPAKLNESKFPDVLELNPHQSFAGIWQTIDYMRRKYAPNVMISYTLKTWGSTGYKYTEPEGGWDNSPEVQAQADYLNNYGVQWDAITYNFNPGAGYHTDEEYRAGSKYFSAVSKKLKNQDNRPAVTYAWKTNISDKYYTDPYGDWLEDAHLTYFFRNIDFLADSTNCIGITVGYGNQLGQYFPPAIYDWIEEYLTGEEQNIRVHGTLGQKKLPL